jgi:hypothetical protein
MDLPFRPCGGVGFEGVFAVIAWILGIISAWHGGRIHGGDPKAIKNLAWCLPFMVTAAIYCPVWCVPFTLLCYLKTCGHGRFFDVWDPFKVGAEPEKIEWVMKWLLDDIPLPAYKVLGMSLVGLLAVSGGVIAFGVVNPMAGLVLAIGGLFKGVNHLIFNKSTDVREFADGCAAGGALALACDMVS